MADSVEVSFTCKQCGSRLEVPADETPESWRPCPDCGSTLRNTLVKLEATLAPSAGHRMKAKDPTWKGKKKKYSREDKHSREISRDLDVPVDRYQMNDRKNDVRLERVSTLDGRVIYEMQEPLSEHTDHGSAMPKEVGEEDASGPKDR